MPHMLDITTGSRLHFGLLVRPCVAGGRMGGVGALVDRPGLRVRLSHAERFCCAGPYAERLQRIAQLWSERWCMSQLPPCSIEATGPPLHVGLGVGTQLTLAVSASLHQLFDVPVPSIRELADATQRGRRSLVGTYGFALGGMLLDRGADAQRGAADAIVREPLPAEWRFLVVCPTGGRGMCGRHEEHVFEALQRQALPIAARLERIAVERLIPAVRRADFDSFAASLHEYGRVAGRCFAAFQGGVFGDPQAELIDKLRRWGGCRCGAIVVGPVAVRSGAR